MDKLFINPQKKRSIVFRRSTRLSKEQYDYCYDGVYRRPGNENHSEWLACEALEASKQGVPFLMLRNKIIAERQESVDLPSMSRHSEWSVLQLSGVRDCNRPRRCFYHHSVLIYPVSNPSDLIFKNISPESPSVRLGPTDRSARVSQTIPSDQIEVTLCHWKLTNVCVKNSLPPVVRFRTTILPCYAKIQQKTPDKVAMLSFYTTNSPLHI